MNRNDLEKLFGPEVEIEDLRKWTVNDVAGYLAVTGYEADPEDVVNSIRIVCAASALGSIKSDRKAAASRENGKLGGRPRQTPAVITDIKIVFDGEIYWTEITTDKTPGKYYRMVGYETERIRDYHIGQEITLSALGGIPSASYVYCNLKDGTNIVVGTMSDRVNDICGKMAYVLTRGDESMITDKMLDVAHQGAEIFSKQGKQAAIDFLTNSGLFKSIFEFHGGDVHKNDPHVWDVR